MNRNLNRNFQTTLLHPVSLSGIGLHSGSKVRINILSGAADTGIVFRRMDVEPLRSMIAARYDAVCDTRLGTTIKNEHGVTIATIEHLMAALYGAGIDNALIEIDAPELPIMDGSSEPFMQLLEKAGIARLGTARKILKVIKEVEVREGESVAKISPHGANESGFIIDIEVEYDNAIIGRQAARYDFTADNFRAELSKARTFGFEYEVEAMQQAGLALGGSLDNAIVVGENKILNEGGLRFADEFVRHKALDVVGDMFLAGMEINGVLKVSRPGHMINNKLLRKLLGDSSAYIYVLASELVNNKELTNKELLLSR